MAVAVKPEAKVKRYLKKQCGCRGWQCKVLVDTVSKKWPDRTIIAPGGRIAFVEVKAEGAPMDTPHVRGQREKLEELYAMGFPAVLVEGNSGVDSLIHTLSDFYRWPVSTI